MPQTFFSLQIRNDTSNIDILETCFTKLLSKNNKTRTKIQNLEEEIERCRECVEDQDKEIDRLINSVVMVKSHVSVNRTSTPRPTSGSSKRGQKPRSSSPDQNSSVDENEDGLTLARSGSAFKPVQSRSGAPLVDPIISLGRSTIKLFCDNWQDFGVYKIYLYYIF